MWGLIIIAGWASPPPSSAEPVEPPAHALYPELGPSAAEARGTPSTPVGEPDPHAEHLEVVRPLLEALRALDPKPAECLDPTIERGCGGTSFTWHLDGSVTGDIDVRDAVARACWSSRVAQVVLPARPDVLHIRYPLCVDSWPEDGDAAIE